MNYAVFDPFLARDTWYTRHPTDEQVFFQCLDKVVRRPDFSAEAMGDHFKDAKDVTSDGHQFDEAIKSYVSRAWAVRQYLEATGAL
jgi:hypothetical protein